MFCVCDRITNDILEENLEDAPSLFIDQTRDTLDTATTSQTMDSRLGDALNAVTNQKFITPASCILILILSTESEGKQDGAKN